MNLSQGLHLRVVPLDGPKASKVEKSSNPLYTLTRGLPPTLAASNVLDLQLPIFANSKLALKGTRRELLGCFWDSSYYRCSCPRVAAWICQVLFYNILDTLSLLGGECIVYYWTGIASLDLSLTKGNNTELLRKGLCALLSNVEGSDPRPIPDTWSCGPNAIFPADEGAQNSPLARQETKAKWNSDGIAGRGRRFLL